MPDDTGLSLEYAVMCEGVGREAVGKDILVGAVPDGLQAVAFPLTLRIAFWCVVKAEGAAPGDHKFRLRLASGDNDEIALYDCEANFTLGQGTKGRNAFVMPAIEARIEKPMDCVLQCSFDDQPFKPSRTIPFIQMKTTEATTQPVDKS